MNESEKKTKQQIKYGSGLQAARAIIYEYCDYSSMHGIKYLGQKKRSCLERVFWSIVILVSFITCTILIGIIWDQWNDNPVIVSFAERTLAWKIPFPTVTVCPITKARRSIFNFTDIYWKLNDQIENGNAANLTQDEEYKMLAMTQVCNSHPAIDSFGNKTMKSIELIEALETMTPTFNDTFVACYWLPEAFECGKLFKKLITEEGICFSLNLLNPTEVYRTNGLDADFILNEEEFLGSDWHIEDGYKSTADTDAYPTRVFGQDLTIVFKAAVDDFDYMCLGPVQGFRVALSTPGDMPQVSKQYFHVPLDHDVEISIKPKMISSTGLRKFEPHRRQCYFQNERYLRYFNIYSQSNCRLECLVNHTLLRCDCVIFWMPRAAETPVCGPASIKCYIEAEQQLEDCQCLQSCTSISYEAKMDVVGFKEIFLENLSGVTISFQDADFLTYKRSELYGITDFLANCGGLLGLFMGVSLFSIVELVYFCTVRLVTNVRMRRKTSKKLSRVAE